MPAEYESVVTITCDNPNGPHRELDPNDRDGWLFVRVDLQGDVGAVPIERTFCQLSCVATFAELAAVGDAFWSVRTDDLSAVELAPERAALDESSGPSE